MKNVNFSGAILAGANFEAARLERVNFAAADLSNADLTGANLAGSNFSKADLSNADLIGADLAGSDFSGASLERADLTGANLAGSNFSQADLKEGNLDGTNLRGANFDLANLTRASLKTAMLFQANLKNSREVETAFLDNAIYEDVPWEPQPDPIEDDAELFPPGTSMNCHLATFQRLEPLRSRCHSQKNLYFSRYPPNDYPSSRASTRNRSIRRTDGAISRH